MHPRAKLEHSLVAQEPPKAHASRKSSGGPPSQIVGCAHSQASPTAPGCLDFMKSMSIGSGQRRSKRSVFIIGERRTPRSSADSRAKCCSPQACHRRSAPRTASQAYFVPLGASSAQAWLVARPVARPQCVIVSTSGYTMTQLCQCSLRCDRPQSQPHTQPAQLCTSSTISVCARGAVRPAGRGAKGPRVFVYLALQDSFYRALTESEKQAAARRGRCSKALSRKIML